MTTNYDNKVVINIKNNPVKHEQAKHIEVDSHSKETLDFSVIYTPFVKTGRQLVDVFTRGCLVLFHSLVDEHGIRFLIGFQNTAKKHAMSFFESKKLMDIRTFWAPLLYEDFFPPYVSSHLSCQLYSHKFPPLALLEQKHK